MIKKKKKKKNEYICIIKIYFAAKVSWTGHLQLQGNTAWWPQNTKKNKHIKYLMCHDNIKFILSNKLLTITHIAALVREMIPATVRHIFILDLRIRTGARALVDRRCHGPLCDCSRTWNHSSVERSNQWYAFPWLAQRVNQSVRLHLFNAIVMSGY